MSRIDKGKKHIRIDLTVDADFQHAVEEFGFADSQHFFKHAVRALLDVYRYHGALVWPPRYEATWLSLAAPENVDEQTGSS